MYLTKESKTYKIVYCLIKDKIFAHMLKEHILSPAFNCVLMFYIYLPSTKLIQFENKI